MFVCGLGCNVVIRVGSWFQSARAQNLEPRTHTKSHEQRKEHEKNRADFFFAFAFSEMTAKEHEAHGPRPDRTKRTRVEMIRDTSR